MVKTVSLPPTCRAPFPGCLTCILRRRDRGDVVHRGVFPLCRGRVLLLEVQPRFGEVKGQLTAVILHTVESRMTNGSCVLENETDILIVTRYIIIGYVRLYTKQTCWTSHKRFCNCLRHSVCPLDIGTIDSAACRVRIYAHGSYNVVASTPIHPTLAVRHFSDI